MTFNDDYLSHSRLRFFDRARQLGRPGPNLAGSGSLSEPAAIVVQLPKRAVPVAAILPTEFRDNSERCPFRYLYYFSTLRATFSSAGKHFHDAVDIILGTDRVCRHWRLNREHLRQAQV